MAQVTLWGATYSDVPAITVPKTGGGTVTFYESGGGSSAWTKIAEASYNVSTTSGSAATVATLETGHSELWTSAKWVYIRIRDTAGKRQGYFYGSDQFFYNILPANGETANSTSTALRIYARYTTDGEFAVTAGSGSGVYVDYVYTDGRVRIRNRYNSSATLTVNGTYKVEVYLLDTPDSIPIFN